MITATIPHRCMNRVFEVCIDSSAEFVRFSGARSSRGCAGDAVERVFRARYTESSAGRRHRRARRANRHHGPTAHRPYRRRDRRCVTGRPSPSAAARDRRRPRDPATGTDAHERDRLAASGRQAADAPGVLPWRVGSASWAAATVTVKVPLLFRNVGGLLPTSSSRIVFPEGNVYALPSSWNASLPLWFGRRRYTPWATSAWRPAGFTSHSRPTI